MLKINYWYLMIADGKQPLSPQYEENIEKVEWKDEKDVAELLQNSYDSIRDVIQIYLESRNSLFYSAAK